MIIFSDNENFLNLYTNGVSSTSGGYVDDVVNSLTNYQFTSVSHTFHEWGRSVLNYQNCFKCVHLFKPKTVEYINTTKLKGVMQTQDIKRQFFETLDNFYIQVFFVNGKSAFFVDFVKYALSRIYSHCSQNCNFYYFLETRICFVTKSCSISSKVCVYIFFPEISKNDSRKSFIKKILENMWYAISYSAHNIFSHFCGLTLA